MATPIPVGELEPGDHACLTFSDREERLDIVSAFVRCGLDEHQKVVCLTEALTPERLSAELADRGISVAGSERRDQLVLCSSDETWLSGGGFVMAQMLDFLRHQVELARRHGFAGLRVTADMEWATRPVAGVEQLVVFESTMNELFVHERVTAICQYDREHFDPVTLASAAEVHPRAVAATVYFEDPLLRVSRQHNPPGLRAAGEIDYTRIGALGHALAEAVRLDNHIHVNLTQLRFIDVAAAGAVVQAALGVAEGGKMTVTCGRPVHKVLDLIGAADVPHLRVVVTDADP